MGRILEDISKWPIEKRRAKLEEIYEQRIGVPLNLDNPQRFTEKAQWRKLYEDDPRITRCIDKLSFKKYVREILGDGYTAPLIDVWHSPEDVDLNSIPSKCVIKSNCSGASEYVILRLGEGSLDIAKTEYAIKNRWFDRRYLHTNSFFRSYYPIKPCVIVEDLISETKNGVDEYKFLCFDGEPCYVYYAGDRFVDGVLMEHPVLSIFDLNWNNLGVQYGEYINNKNARKPKYMGQMLEISRKLSADFSFVRVDFYETEERVFLSEMTFTWGEEIPFHPDSFDFELGSKWKYPR